MDSGFLILNQRSQKEVADISSAEIKKKNNNIWTRTLCPAKIPFRNKGEIQTFSEEGRLRIVTRRPTFKEMIKEVL